MVNSMVYTIAHYLFVKKHNIHGQSDLTVKNSHPGLFGTLPLQFMLIFRTIRKKCTNICLLLTSELCPFFRKPFNYSLVQEPRGVLFEGAHAPINVKPAGGEAGHGVGI